MARRISRRRNKGKGGQGGKGRSAALPSPTQQSAPGVRRFLELLPNLCAESATALLRQHDDNAALALETYFEQFHDIAEGGNLVQRSIPCGFLNVGNTCFINSVVQLLSKLPALLPLVTGDLLQHINPQSRFGSRDAVLTRKLATVLHRMIYTANQSSTAEATVSQLPFLSALQASHPDFGSDGEQHDADHLLLFVIDKLLEDTNNQDSGVGTNKVDQFPGESDSACANRLVQQERAYNNSPILDDVTNIIKTEQTCLTCGTARVKMERATCLQVPADSGDGSTPQSLPECLDKLCQKVLLDGENQFKCAKCGCKRDAVEETSVQRLANNLIVCLKLPNSTDPTDRVRHSISLQDVDLSENQNERMPDEEAPIYSAVAVIDHHPHTADAGHVTAKGLSENGQWHHFDDSAVAQCPEENVISKDTQIIAFVKRGARETGLEYPPCAAEFDFVGMSADECELPTSEDIEYCVLSISHD